MSPASQAEQSQTQHMKICEAIHSSLNLLFFFKKAYKLTFIQHSMKHCIKHFEITVFEFIFWSFQERSHLADDMNSFIISAETGRAGFVTMWRGDIFISSMTVLESHYRLGSRFRYNIKIKFTHNYLGSPFHNDYKIFTIV